MFLCCVTLAAGLMSAGSEVAEAQFTTTFIISGTVTDKDGAPLPGLEVDVVTPSGFGSFITRAGVEQAGTYSLAYLSFGGGKIYVDDEIVIRVTDGAGKAFTHTHVVTARNVASNPPGAEVDIRLSGLDVLVSTSTLPADGESTTAITVNIIDAGEPVTGDTVTINAEQGSVGDVTDNGDGTYSATYTAPELVLTSSTPDTISIQSAITGEASTATVTLEPVPTLVSVSVTPNSFMAGGTEGGMVEVMVSRGGDPVADAQVSVNANRADGGADAGSVGDVTNNGDGSYSATYTPSNTVGRITIRAADAVSGSSATAPVSINAGAPSSLTVSVSPSSVSSGGSAVVSLMVADASGNGVGGLTPASSVESGSVSGFAEGDEIGSYSATYTAPMVEAEGTDVVTVHAADLTGVATVSLTPEPPVMVSILVVTGTVNKADGTGSVPGVDVEVTVNDHAPVSTTTDGNGSYTVTMVDPGGNAASTGDIVSVVVTDDGNVVGSVDEVLTNEDLDSDSPVVTIDVPTSIVSTTSALVVTGTVYHEGGSLPVGSGMGVSVMNNETGMTVAGMTDADGMYSVTFFDAAADVASTGDTLTVSVMADGAEIGSAEHMLSSAEVDAGQAMVDVNTNMKASTSTLVVTGTVYLLDSEVPAGAGLTVTVSNGDTGMEAGGMTDANGMYNVTLFSPSAPVAETGDVLTVSVAADGEEVGSASPSLTEAQIAVQQAMVDVNTSVPAESSVFNVTGTVYLEDGMSPAPAGLHVTVMNANQPGVEAETVTMAGGAYSVTMVSAMMAVAATHDELVLDVMVTADGAVVGTTSRTLMTDEVVARRISGVDITTSLTADPSNLMVVDGAVSNPDGTPAAAGVEVRITLGSNPTRTLATNAGGGYMTTILDTSAPVVSVGDMLTVEVLDRVSGAAANESIAMASHHVLAQRVTYDIMLIADNIAPVPSAVSSQKFVEKMEMIDFDGSGSTDNVGIDTYMWDFGDGNTTNTMNASHAYANSGKYVVTLTVMDLAGNEASMSIDIFVDTVRLGGMSLNTLHARDVIDKIIKLATARTDVGQSVGADALLQMMRNDPAMQAAVMKAVNSILPPGLLPGQLLDAELPLIFEDYENIDLENFGNALTARPGDGMGILESKDGGFTRIVTGNKLDLYLAAPRGDVGSVTFRFDGPGFDPLSEVGTQDAREAVAGMTMSHTFQLEEQQAALLLPSWSGLGDSGLFSSVNLRYASDALPPEYANLLSRGRQVPVDPTAYASAPLSPMMINGEAVWSGEVGIEPGKIYYYYYEVTLNTPVPLDLGDGQTAMLSSYAVPDPRNLQLEDRGIIDRLFTMEVQDAIAPILNPIISAIMAGQDVSAINIEEILTGENIIELFGALTGAVMPLYADIMTTMNPQMVSVFTVPMSTADQSVWYTTIDLSDVADGVHTIDANAFDSNGVQIDNRPVYGKTFVLDRAAPAIDISVDNGQNSAMYTRDDGVIIATGLITPDPNQMASLMLNASSMDSTDDLGDFMFQIIRHSDDPASQMANTWVPLLDPTIVPMIGGLSAETFDVFIASAFNDMLTLNARAGMPPGMLRSQEMMIRGMNNDPALIAGEYGLRAVGMDNVGNLSSFTMPVRVDIVPPDPDQAVVANIAIGDCNKDGDLEDPFESQAPMESTIFANTGNLTLTIDIPNRTPHPLTGIVVQYKTMHATAGWMDIATIDAAGDVEWNIGDFASLIDGGGDDSHIYVRAVATNALTITDPDPAMPMVKLDAGVCPVEPEHVAVNVVPAGTNEETGGYCGIITVHGYTAARTIPDLASVRFDLTLPDGSTMTIGEAAESEVLSELLSADLLVVLDNLIGIITHDGMGTSAPEATYRKWSITFNTASLLDSLDAPYVVSATMIGADGMEYAPIAGGTDDFLLHNGEVEVGTTITAVADAYGALEMTDGGFFQLGGITAEGYDTPVAILTVDPAAPDWRVAGINLLVNMRNDDGSKGDAVDVGEVTVEEAVSVDMADMTKTSSDKIYTVTITDLSGLGVGGDYVLQVLAHDSKAEPDVEAEDPAFGVAANVDNFTPPPMITIDGRGEGMSLADFMAAHPLGYRIAQSDDNMFPFSMNAPGVLMGDITVQIDGGTLAADLAPIDGMRHDFSIVANTSTTGEGDHPASVTVTKRNGSASFDLVNLAIDRIAPVITVLSPTEDDEVSALPTIHAIYNDGEGYGIAVASDDPLDVPANVEIQISRLNPPDESSVPVDQAQLDDADDEVVYSPDDALTGGAYRTDVSVTDKWGNRSSMSAEFTIAGTAPSVTILSPASDSVSDDGMPLISAVVTGSGALDVVTMIDGEAVDTQMDGKYLRYTPDPALEEGEHRVSIQATDADGKMGDAAVIFTVDYPEPDMTPPVVTQVSPQGFVWGGDVTLSVTAVDDQSGVASIAIALDGGEAVDGATRAVEGLTVGQHMATATVTNGDGYSQDYSWTFTVANDDEPPTIGSTSPHGVTRTTTPAVTASATDLTGIASIAIAVMNSNGDAVEGETAMSEDGTSATFMPAGELANGVYSVTAVVADNYGNSASTSWSFTVEASYDTTMPSINVVSPQGIVRVDMPSVSASASDVSDTAQEGLSGIANMEISVAASDGSAVGGSSEFDGSGSAVFTPGGALANGEYMATATVTDNSGNTNTASWTFTVEVIMDVAEPVIGVTSPSGIVRVDMPTIAASATDALSGVGSIDISVTASDGSAVAGSSEFDGGTMGTFTPAAGLANDTYTATAVVTDNAGNETKGSWSFTVEVVMDTLPPIITATSPHGLVRDDMPSINVSATDDMSGVARIAISVSKPAGLIAGNTEFDGAGLGTFTPDAALTNGTYTVVTVVTDNAGNSSSASWSFTLEADRSAPVINATSPQGTIRTNRPRIDVSASDDISGLASFAFRVIRSDFVRVDGNMVFDGGTKASFTPSNALRNDTYSVAADVTDKAGNVTNVSWSFTVQVDTTPPVISANSPLGIVRDDMPRVSVSAADDESGMRNIQIRVLNSAFQRIGGRTIYEGGTTAAFVPERALRNDTYTVGVTATDKAGNSANASWSFAIEADHTPPVINVTSPQGIIREDMPRVSVSATDDVSGIANIEIRVLNSAFQRVAGPTTFQGGTFGFFTPSNRMKNDTYTVGVKVTDKAGNSTDANWVFTIEVDEVPPTIGDTGPHGIIRTSKPRVTVSATDDLSGIKTVAFRVVNNKTFARVSGRTNYQGGTFASWSPTGNMRNGVYSVGVDVTDKSGNVATSGWSFTVEVDTVPPTIGHTSPSGSVRPENPVISVHAADDLSGIGSIAIVLRDSNQKRVPGKSVFEGGTIGTFIPSAPLDFGTHYVGVKVKDKAGNEASATYSFTVESADGLAVLNARNFPNPFAGATRIAFTLTRSSEISIEIFDISMRPVWYLSPRTIQATREHVIAWDGTTSGGEKLARGVYFCQIMVHDSLNPQYAILKMAIK